MSKTDVGHMAAVGTVLVTGSLGFGAGVLKEMNFTEIISHCDDSSVVGSNQCVDVCPIRSFRPDSKDLEA